MQPATLSASSVACFESCEARYRATYIDRGREMGGRAAILGTTVHEALDHAVTSWMTHTPGQASQPTEEFTRKALKLYFRHRAASNGLTADQIKQGESMLDNFMDWHDENGWNEVLCAEVKETFTLKHPKYGEVPFTYIWDRGDRMLKDGSIEVIDYKSFGQPMPVDELRTKIQVRAYGLSAQIKYKETPPPWVWVTYFLLRFGPISVRFSKEDNLETWRYLQDVFARIVESDGSQETINSECKWCVRKANCETLKRHVDVGGILSLKPEQQARLYAETKDRISALRTLSDELETQLNDHLEREEIIEDTFDGVRVFLKPTTKREIDSERAAKIVGPELAAKWGTIGITVIDKMMKQEPALTEDMKLELKRIIRTNAGAKLEVKEFTPFDDSAD